MSDKHKMTKDIVPEDFTLSLAIVDAIPVIFFGMSMVLLGSRFSGALFIIGALISLFAGAAKVLWKIIVVLKKKNIWFLFLQMRIAMPVGFLMMVISLILNRERLDFNLIWGAIISFPAVVFLAIGLVGMVLMGVFGAVLDGSNVKSNWIEQITNGIAQICIFIGILLA